ncbi:MAG: response regulator [Pseudomonadota bacterium]
MNREEPLPYYYPTTVCFIDDNASYLESLSLHIPEHWPHRMFHSGSSALVHINRPDKPPSIADRCFSALSAGQMSPSQAGPGLNPDTQISVDLSVIEREIARPNRFEDISVLLVDYAMPTMDGLEMCAQVQDPDVRIVLLTGVADEAVAVEAFNQGLIHQYIRKGTAEPQQSTFDTIEALRREYIANCTHGLFAGLRALPASYRQDRSFQTMFETIIKDRHISEYYLVTEPQGYILIDIAGNFSRLVVLNEHELLAQQSLLAQFGAPETLQQGLQNQKLIGYFYEHPQDYGDEPFPWHDMLIDAQVIEGERSGQTWFAGVHNTPPIDIDFDLTQSSLERYLNHLDPLTGNFTAQSRRARGQPLP